MTTTIKVSSGHPASGLSFTSGIVVDVLSGGKSLSNTVDAGAELMVFAGGTATATQVSGGGLEVISKGGKDSASTVFSGGRQTVLSGGSAVTTVVSRGGLQYVSSGGIANAVSVGSGGDEEFVVGAQFKQLSLAKGANLTEVDLQLSGTSTTLGTLAKSAVVASIGSGGITQDLVATVNATVSSGGIEFVTAGGKTVSTTIDLAGFEILSSGIASATTIEPFGEQIVSAGGHAIGTVINGSNAYEYLYTGATASRSLVHNGGQEYVSGGAVATGDLVDNLSFEVVFAHGGASGTIVTSGGELTVSSAGYVAYTTLSGGTLVVYSSGTALNAVTFVGSGGTLAVVDPITSASGTAVMATLSGFGPGDTIDLSGIPYVPAGAHAAVSGGVLKVSDGGKVYSFTMDPTHSYVGDTFHVSASPDNGFFGHGTDITVTSPVAGATSAVLGDAGAQPWSVVPTWS